jgi:hypothetical protein
MTIGRRCFVAGALASVAATGLHAQPAAARIPPASPDPVMLLLDPDAPGAFVAAAAGTLAASGLPVIDRRAGDIAVVAASVAWLAARPGRRIVGLLSDADAVLLDQFTRDAAIRCLSSAQHCGDGGASRHRITALSSNAGLARLLVNELAAAGTNFSVAAEPLATPRSPLPSAASLAPADRSGRGWDDTLGRTLATIAAGAWPTRAPDGPGRFEGRGSRAETFALRSFVFAS